MIYKKIKNISIKHVIFISAIVLILCMMYLHSRGEKEILYDINSLTWHGGYPEGTCYVFDETNKAGIVCETDTLPIRKGNYVVRVTYSEQYVPNILRVVANDSIYESELPLEHEFFEMPINLTDDVRSIKIQLEYQNVGLFKITSIEIIGENRFYTDTFYYMFLLLILVCCGYFLYHKYIIFMNVRDKISLMLVCVAVFISCLPLMSSVMPIGHDSVWHWQRIEVIKESLELGNFPVRVVPTENNGYGFLLTLYPSLFVYPFSLLRIMNVSMAAVYKSFIAVINIFMAFSTYYCVKSICNHNNKSVNSWYPALASVFICLFPYRLIDLYVRAAISEALAMAFLPFVISGLYHVLVGNYKRWILIVIGATGIFNSHIITTELTLVLSIIIIIPFIKQLTDKNRLKSLISAVGVTLLVNLFYLIPFLYYYLTKATRVSGILNDDYKDYAMDFRNLFIQPAVKDMAGNVFKIPPFGIIGVLCIILVFCLLFYQKKNQCRKFVYVITIISLIFMLSMTSLLPFQQLSKISLFRFFMSSLQFPYRMLIISIVLLSMVTGIAISNINISISHVEQKLPIIFIIVIVSAMQVFSNDSETKPKTRNYLEACNSDYFYMPLGAEDDCIDNKDLYSSDDINIGLYSKYGNEIKLEYSGNNNGEYIELPVFWFSGYRAYNESGNPVRIGKGEYSRIRIYMDEQAESGTIYINYKENIWFILGTIVSLLTVLLGIIYLARKKLAFNGIEET